MNPLAAARLFLLARGRVDNRAEDEAALTALIADYAMSGYQLGLEFATNAYRSRHSGGCKMLSQGDACNCFLCCCDQQKHDALGERKTVSE